VLAILHSKLVPPTDWMMTPLVVDFPPIGATHRLGFTPRWGSVLIIPSAHHGAFPRHGRPGHAVFRPGC